MSDTGNHCIKYYARNKEVKTLNLNVEFPIGTCLTSDSRLIIIDWKGAKMLRNGKISAPVSGSRVAKIYKGKISFTSEWFPDPPGLKKKLIHTSLKGQYK